MTRPPSSSRAAGQVRDRAGAATPAQSLLTPAMLQAALAGRQIRAEVRIGPGEARYRELALRRTRHGRRRCWWSPPRWPTSTGRWSGSGCCCCAGPLALPLAGGGGWLLARAALRPVDRMTEQAGAIGLDRLGRPGVGAGCRRRADPPGPHPQRHARAARARRGAQRRFAADASHELRTPLAVMRAELEVALRDRNPGAGASEVLDSAAEEVARMSTIVDDLLTLAHRDENRLELLLEPVDLGWSPTSRRPAATACRGGRCPAQGGGARRRGGRGRPDPPHPGGH